MRQGTRPASKRTTRPGIRNPELIAATRTRPIPRPRPTPSRKRSRARVRRQDPRRMAEDPDQSSVCRHAGEVDGAAVIGQICNRPFPRHVRLRLLRRTEPLCSARRPSLNRAPDGPALISPANQRAIQTASDYSEAEPRVEVMCRRCGAHLGHVFDDGPPPTGLRFCINSAAIKLNSSERGNQLENGVEQDGVEVEDGKAKAKKRRNRRRRSTRPSRKTTSESGSFRIGTTGRPGRQCEDRHPPSAAAGSTAKLGQHAIRQPPHGHRHPGLAMIKSARGFSKRESRSKGDFADFRERKSQAGTPDSALLESRIHNSNFALEGAFGSHGSWTNTSTVVFSQ